MKIGNVSLNPAAFKDYTKDQFFDEFKGKLDVDKEVVWNQIVEENKQQITFDEIIPPNELKEIIDQTVNEAKKKIVDESTDSTGAKSKRNNRK